MVNQSQNILEPGANPPPTSAKPRWGWLFAGGAFVVLLTGIVSTIAGIFLYSHIMTMFYSCHPTPNKFSGREESRLPSLPPPHFPGKQKLSYDWALRDLDGKRIDFSAFEGKIVFLNYWATWCLSCIQEMKSIEKLQDKFKGQIIFACVADDNAETINKFLKKHNFKLPFYTLYSDPPEELAYQELPTTYVLENTGHIALKHIGAADWNHPSSINFFIDLLDKRTAK